MREEFKKKVNEVYLESCKNPQVLQLGMFDNCTWLFAHIFDKRPYIASLEGTSENVLKYMFNEDFTKEELIVYDMIDVDKLEVSDNYPVIIEKGLDSKITYDKIVKEYLNEGIFLSNDVFVTEDFLAFSGVLFLTSYIIPERVKSCFTKRSEEKPTYRYISCGNRGFRSTPLDVEDLTRKHLDKGISFEDNYNDDFPIDKLTKFVNSNESGLSLLYGVPGCGKSSAIRHLIYENPKIKFCWLDESMLSQVNNSDFLDFLLDNKNSVFILEDCDILIQSRDKGGNGLINSLLNMSDGILGDSLHIKFIGTFNTHVSNIDSALKRKGRMKIMHELKALSKDKVKNLFDKLGINEEAKEMPLCDVYNYYEDNGSKQPSKKIGF